MEARSFVLALVVFAAGAAYSQDIPATVGELTGKGGTQLSTEELKTLLSGATITGMQMNVPTSFKNLYKPDGTIEGAITDGPSQHSIDGNWTVTGGGLVLSDFRPAQGRPFQGKAYWYKLGDRYFQAGGTAPYEKVMVREVTR
jgi:hypothetical protein